MSTAEFEDKAQVNARFTASHTRGMESTIGAEETHAQSRRRLVIGDAMAVISALSKGRSSSQMPSMWRAASAFVPASFARSRVADGCPASGTEQTFSHAIVSISGGHQSFRSMWSHSSSQTRLVSAPAFWNKRHKRAPLPASVTPSLSPKVKSTFPLSWLMVILLINEVNLTREYGGGPSCGFDLCAVPARIGASFCSSMSGA